MKKRRFLTAAIGGTGILVGASHLIRRAGATRLKSEPSPVTVRLVDPSGSLTKPFTMPGVAKKEAAWHAQLTEEEYRVTRSRGTERAFSGLFHDNHKSGLYTCVCCGLPLFQSEAKFDSGTGWPSFFQPVADENIVRARDLSLLMVRTEIHCARCDAHLGHVFDDGPPPSRMRYCINSVALRFHEAGVKGATGSVYFGAGCFWGVESTFDVVQGVVSTRVGYTGGFTRNPTYREVCADRTGHAEVVEVVYDTAQIEFDQLLDIFWHRHDPTLRRMQGRDVSSQYRSAIYFTTPGQEALVWQSAAQLEAGGTLRGPIATEIQLAGPFYEAEEYHQKYHAKRSLKSCLAA